jgi:hypothetical protein
VTINMLDLGFVATRVRRKIPRLLVSIKLPPGPFP